MDNKPEETFKNISFTHEAVIKSNQNGDSITVNQTNNFDFENLRFKTSVDMSSKGLVSSSIANNFYFLKNEMAKDNLNLKSSVILSPTQFYTNLENISYYDHNEQKNDLGWYYKDLLDEDDETISSMEDISQEVRELFKEKPSQMISTDTGKKIVEPICNLIKGVEVGGVKNFNFGKEEKEIKARFLDVQFQENAINTSSELFPNIIQSVIDDEVLKKHIKLNYSTFNEINKEYKSITKTATIVKEKDYDKSVDTVFNYSSEKLKTYTAKPQNSPYKTKIKDLDLFVNSADGALQGLKIKLNMEFSKEYLEHSKYREFLSSGVEIDYQIYDIYLNNSIYIEEPKEQSETIYTAIKDLERLKFE